jgi:predicted tellurium resistance membrane protein TerC
MEWLNCVVGLSSLILLEIILGIDNVVFLGILAHRLPPRERKRVVRWGVTLAWVARLAMLASALWLVKLTQPFLTVGTYAFSVHDLFFIVGGAFLIAKATQEIHGEVLKDQDDEPDCIEQTRVDKKILYWKVVFQIALMDVIFSFDSVLTAVGLTTQYWVMSVAITISILVMLFASHKVNEMIVRYPTLKMLALSFLMLIGMVLVADGFALHIPRGYVYFAMIFSLGVESLNLFKRNRRSKI